MKVSIVFILLFMHLTGFAHSDYIYSKKYGNVSVSITTGYAYEEINKAYMLGMYAEKLARELNFKDAVVVNYWHWYTTPSVASGYFLSVGKGEPPQIK